MNRHVTEEQIALLAGGDLTDKQEAEIARHVSACPSCSSLLQGYRKCHSGLSALGNDPLTVSDYADVRRVVLDRILSQSTGRVPFRWFRFLFAARPYAMAGLLVCALLLGFWKIYRAGLTTHTRGPNRPQMVDRSGSERVEPVLRGAIDRSGRHVPHLALSTRRRKPVSLLSEVMAPAPPSILPGPPFDLEMIDPMRIEPEKWSAPTGQAEIVVKLETGDPNVVIIWVIEGRGE